MEENKVETALESMEVEQVEESNDLDMMHEELKIPKDRVAVLIGSSGKTKLDLEVKSGCKIDVESASGLVDISGSDPIKLFDCKDIVLAVGRGFNPKVALKLLLETHSLEVIRLRDIVGSNQKQMERIKSRVIGRAGKVRGELERLTKCDIAVYGKTVSIIGDSMDVALCHRAIEMLLKGAMHKTVYTFLEKQVRQAELAGV